MLTIAETDGCTVDGISVATGCTVGHRTLRIEDYGKIAATFIDIETSRAIRLAPRSTVRERASDFAPAGTSKWEKYLFGYQQMPDDLLFAVQSVEPTTPIEQIVSKPGCRAICKLCHEEIINRREIIIAGKSHCRSCAGQSYYKVLKDASTSLMLSDVKTINIG